MSYHSHRPELHVSPEQGVLNAPAGALKVGSNWHIFHQYQPTVGAPARIAHQYAEHLPFDWDICDDVLAAAEGEVKVRAGSVVGLDDNTVELFFTSITDVGTQIHVATIADLDDTTDTVSEDALALDPGVVRHGAVVSDRDGFVDFRSPCVLVDWQNDAFAGWLMLAVTGSQDEPRLVVLDSPDRREWRVLGAMAFSGTSGLEGISRIVSPRMIRLRDEVDGQRYDILLVTLEHEGIDISGYLVGKLSGTNFEVKTPFTRLDFGHDFTRPRNTNVVVGPDAELPDFSSAQLFGLLNGIGRFDDPHEHPSLEAEGWVNCLSLPRLVTLQDGLLYQTPAPGLPQFVSQSSRAAMYSAIIDTTAQDATVQVELIDGNGAIAATVSHLGDTIELDRSMNSAHLGDHIAEGPLVAADTDSMTIIVDGSTVEVFADGGALAMASRVYFDNGFAQFRVHKHGSAHVERDMEIFPIDYSELSKRGPAYGMEPPLDGEYD
ncbi:GH32 C-terminal domain-containing protein [Corynebacterium epidermidicanis]|uniref:beta-fructofuranosidase n=1 Tax=Corynebacterium epidermidicanis TaxID=1050174 RepID=A0A0G3GVE0_9CORY|nr:GH32 C-terminal domain-containing protein [Corynebacterium epidermidicanis]AKK02822.1 beta-fructosidase, levanase/invertase [Corynebacterium epidermidicanis]